MPAKVKRAVSAFEMQKKKRKVNEIIDNFSETSTKSNLDSKKRKKSHEQTIHSDSEMNRNKKTKKPKGRVNNEQKDGKITKKKKRKKKRTSDQEVGVSEKQEVNESVSGLTSSQNIEKSSEISNSLMNSGKTKATGFKKHSSPRKRLYETENDQNDYISNQTNEKPIKKKKTNSKAKAQVPAEDGKTVQPRVEDKTGNFETDKEHESCPNSRSNPIASKSNYKQADGKTVKKKMLKKKRKTDQQMKVSNNQEVNELVPEHTISQSVEEDAEVGDSLMKSSGTKANGLKKYTSSRKRQFEKETDSIKYISDQSNGNQTRKKRSHSDELGAVEDGKSVQPGVEDKTGNYETGIGNEPAEECTSWQNLTGIRKSLISLSKTNARELEHQPQIRPDAVGLDDGSVLLVLDHPAEVPLKGRARISCLTGSVKILGYELKPGGSPCDVFSPDCYSLVTIVTESGEQNVQEAMNFVQNQLTGMERQNQKLAADLKKVLKAKECFVILWFSKIETTLCSFIQGFKPYANIFRSVGDKSFVNKKLLSLGAFIPRDQLMPCLEVPGEIQEVLNCWRQELDKEESPVMMVCGGKNSGKSTTNRMITNSTLNMRGTVYYLECDVGQTEFTPSGVVSLVRLTQPVLGPAFCHHKDPICAFFYGGVTPRDDPDVYLQCVEKCVQYYRELASPKPLVVNTMGWMKDLGWQLLVDTVRLVSPSVIVQLTSHDRYQNVEPLTSESLESVSWSDLSQSLSPTEWTLSRLPKVIHIEDPIYTSYDFKLNPVDYRNLGILSHLGNNLEPGLTLTSMIPYTIEWKNVCVHVCHKEVPRSQIMYALNASLVALCNVDTSEAEEFVEDGPWFLPSNAVYQWIGFGIVRGIDPVKKLFYVITSVPYDQLSRVNAIVKGGVVLPEHILTQQKELYLPYADEVVSSVGIHCKKPRKRLARISNPSNKKS